MTSAAAAWLAAALLWYPSRLPWLLPMLILTCVVARTAGERTADWLGVPRAIAWMALGSTGVILAGTVTPLSQAFRSAPQGTLSCDLSRVGPAGWAVLSGPSDALFNIVMFVPLGFALALAPASIRKSAVVGGALLLPVAIEAVQSMVPPLGRGCQSADVADNLTGLLLGLCAGTVVACVKARAPRTKETQAR